MSDVSIVRDYVNVNIFTSRSATDFACYEIRGKFQLTTFNLPTHLIYVFDVVKSSLDVFWFVGIEL